MEKKYPKKPYVFDFSLSCEIIENDYNLIIKLLKEFCKKGNFQKEESPDFYRHWQGRVSLKKRITLSGLIKCTPITLKGIHWSPTSEECQNDINYVNKEWTRIEGPWDINDEPIILTKQLEIFMKYDLYPWQETVKNNCTIYDDRSINMIYDNEGDIGKSIFCEYLEFNNLAEEIPPFRLMDDIFQWVYSFAGKPAYFIDLPRGMKKDKLGDFYSGIEIIKNGVCYDKRYHGRKKRFTRPVVWIFSNMLPCFDLMTKSRWKVFTVNTESMTLETYCSAVGDL